MTNMSKTRNRNSKRSMKRKEAAAKLPEVAYSTDGGVDAVGSEAKVKRTVDLKAEIEKEMQNFNYKRKNREVRFASLDFIAKLYQSSNSRKLRLSLHHDLWTVGRDEGGIEKIRIEKLEEYVRTQACRLYAVLLLAGQPQAIVHLYKSEHPVTDHIFEKGESRNDVSYCSKEYLRTLPQLRDFAETIFEHQWCIPPVLRRDVVQKFPVQSFRFPFVDKPQPIGEGAGGEVFKVKVACGHLEAGEGYIEGSVVAHKEIAKGKMTDEKVLREVNTIRSRQHPNIIPLLACFSAGREKPYEQSAKVECLHMLFEHADAGDMATWLAQDEAPAPLADMVTRRKHIMESIEQIVSAVTYIHSEIDGYTAYHHDLKPGNIVRFEGPPANWKICDFGMANLKHHDDDSGTVRRADNRFGSFNYQPPEYFDNNKATRHGRAFDVWSLGCIILELATVWKYGWSDAGTRKFRALIEESSKRACRFKKNGGPDYSFHNNCDAIEDWIHRLGDSRDVEKDFGWLLDLISEMLVQKAQRIFVWEVDMDLYEMAHPNCAEDELKKHLREVVQRSETPLNALNNEHNPLRRAKQKGKRWQENILRRNQWSIDEPEPTKQLIVKRHDTIEHYTTMEVCSHAEEFESNQLIGRHELDVQITQEFGESTCVGLYGLSGIGKSHLAYQYVVRFRNTDLMTNRKHTFWVDASSETKLEETVGLIAKSISLDTSTSKGLHGSMNQWLSDAVNGPWIMVIDGLDHLDVAALVKCLIPKDGGQILITTKDRGILNSLEGFLRRKACFRVEQLTVSGMRLMFQRYNEDVLPDTSEMDDLLSSLLSPASVKLLAKYALNNNIPTSELYDSMKEARNDGKSLRFPKASYGDLTQVHRVLQPLVKDRPLSAASNGIVHSWPSQEFGLLSQLSCFDKDEIDFRLIQQNYRNGLRLRELLGSLENGCFVTRRINNVQSYFMYENVQELIREWVLSSMGFVALLNLHQTALCMLILAYKEEKKREADAKKIQRTSYLWKEQFMLHFERFLGLAREYTERLDQIPTSQFVCEDRTVHAVITFAQAFLYEGRYDDAICVLDFIRRLYNRPTYRPHLIRHLCKAYTLPPFTSRNQQGLRETIQRLEMVIHELSGQTEGEREQKWLCLLEMANSHCKASQPEKASLVLKGLQEIRVVMRNDKPELYRPGDEIFKPYLERELAVRKLIVEARIHVAKAGCSSKGRLENEHLQSARTAFTDAKSAVLSWFPRESQWVSELEEDIADVLCKLRDAQLTKIALKIYDKLIRQFDSEFAASNRPWGQTRAWDLKCKHAQAQMQLELPRPDPTFKKAITILKNALKFYEMNFGKHDEQHDAHTRVCAHLLQEAYEKDGNISKAREIEKRYCLQSENYVHFPDVVAERRIMDRRMIFLVIISVAIYLFKIYTTSNAYTGLRQEVFV